MECVPAPVVPAASGQGVVVVDGDDAAPAQGPLDGLRILIAEDDPGLAAAVADVLGDAGATIIGPYTTPGEALGAVRGGRLDAAYLDLELRLGVSEHVLASAREAGIPVLLVSAYDQCNLPAWTVGVPFLPKPVTARTVTEAFISIIT